MRNPSNPCFNFASLFSLLLLILHSRPTKSQEVEDQKEFDYLVGSGRGPDKWGELHKEWEACKRGDLQSPIDLKEKRVEVLPKLGKIKKNYKPSIATLRNRGHDISLQWKIGSAGSIRINGTDYELQQCHWHSPSEHTFNGKRFDLELHMVHLSSDPKVPYGIAVIGVLYRIGKPDPFLSELKKHMKAIADSHKEVKLGAVNPTHLKNVDGKKYFKYVGSLTVPPCTEGVIWTISTRVRTVSKEQVELLRTAVHDFAERNARPLQALNDRDIHLYGSTT